MIEKWSQREAVCQAVSRSAQHRQQAVLLRACLRRMPAESVPYTGTFSSTESTARPPMWSSCPWVNRMALTFERFRQIADIRTTMSTPSNSSSGKSDQRDNDNVVLPAERHAVHTELARPPSGIMRNLSVPFNFSSLALLAYDDPARQNLFHQPVSSTSRSSYRSSLQGSESSVFSSRYLTITASHAQSPLRSPCTLLIAREPVQRQHLGNNQRSIPGCL